MTETAIRNELTLNAVAKVAEALNAAGLTVTKTKDFQTLTFEVGQVDSGTKQYTAYGSVKFTLHKSDFSLEDAVWEYNDKVEQTEKRKAELAEKKAKVEADRAAKKAKREADKTLKQSN
jgi:hypothetical protein